MQYLLYLSTAKQSSSAAVQFDMLRLYAALMQHRHITGLLLCDRGNVLHYMEGEEADLMVSYRAVATEPFEKDAAIITQGRLSARRCADWEMAYWLKEPIRHPAYSPLMRDPTISWPDDLATAPELVPLRNFRARSFGQRSGTDLSSLRG